MWPMVDEGLYSQPGNRRGTMFRVWSEHSLLTSIPLPPCCLTIDIYLLPDIPLLHIPRLCNLFRRLLFSSNFHRLAIFFTANQPTLELPSCQATNNNQ